MRCRLLKLVITLGNDGDHLNQPRNAAAATGQFAVATAGPKSDARKTFAAPTRKPVQKYSLLRFRLLEWVVRVLKLRTRCWKKWEQAEKRNPFGDKGNNLTLEDFEKMMKEQAAARHASLVKFLENKLAIVKGKIIGAEKALTKVQENLKSAELPNDLETLTDEERFLFPKGYKVS
ncbi:hypothetical protein M9H77_03406 [Catharanthus roseus]|uniref:Uncharacterized protein n=1 Tax=Catharanthus roseus TaxID=4058 RepID=A0ACC0CB24_CATRO|nr:hypothetical protein M9H77_03406 [Catharanthus roseus]